MLLCVSVLKVDIEFNSTHGERMVDRMRTKSELVTKRRIVVGGRVILHRDSFAGVAEVLLDAI